MVWIDAPPAPTIDRESDTARVLPEINAGMTDAGCAPGTVRRTVGAIKVERCDWRSRDNIRRAFHKLALLPLGRGRQGRVEIARQRHALLIGPVVRPDVLLIVRQRGRRCSGPGRSLRSRRSLCSGCSGSDARL